MSGVDSRTLILVVDDHEAGRFAKVQTLTRAGFTVVEAGTGEAALRLAARMSPDLVLLDVNLPDISGLEVCERLRSTAPASLAPQIVHISSTAVTTADRVRGLERGADVYLTEPIEGEVLVATIRALARARRAEIALAAALERERAARAIAEEASRLKDEFLATLSHELRTPLNALMGWIWQLRYSTLDERMRSRALESLDRNTRVQAQLINDLLDISRISKGKLHLRMQLIDLRSVIDDALDSVRDAAAAKQLSVAVAHEPGCRVVGDTARLQQIVTNLLTNAVQFTPENGQIDLRLLRDGDDVVLEVQDTGSGIEAAFLPYVFDQFRQGEGGQSRKHGGLGLGLAVVRQLVDLHGGSVAVASSGQGAGTTFTIRLPFEPGEKSESEEDDSPVLSGMRVLVAHPAAEDLAAILEASGAVTDVTQSPDDPKVLAADACDAIVAPAGVVAPNVTVPVVVVGDGTNAGDLVRQLMHVRPKPVTAAPPAS